MTRSEERLNVGTRTEETGRGRLRKYVVTEQQSVQVPVTREEVRLEREPINPDNYDEAVSGADISEEDHPSRLIAKLREPQWRFPIPQKCAEEYPNPSLSKR